jgi:hypothetical protein
MGAHPLTKGEVHASVVRGNKGPGASAPIGHARRAVKGAIVTSIPAASLHIGRSTPALRFVVY